MIFYTHNRSIKKLQELERLAVNTIFMSNKITDMDFWDIKGLIDDSIYLEQKITFILQKCSSVESDELTYFLNVSNDLNNLRKEIQLYVDDHRDSIEDIIN